MTRFISVLLFFLSHPQANAVIAPPPGATRPILVATPVVPAQAPPTSPNAPNVLANMAGALTWAIQMGPDIWVPTGLADPASTSFYGEFSPSFTLQPLPPASPPPPPAPYPITAMPIYATPTLGVWSVINDTTPTALSFGSGIGIFSVFGTLAAFPTTKSGIVNSFSMKGIYSPLGVIFPNGKYQSPQLPTPSLNTLPLFPSANMIQFGFFTGPSSMPSTTTPTQPIAWAIDYANLVNHLSSLASPLKIAGDSRGMYFYNQSVFCLNQTTSAARDACLRNLYSLNRQKIASYEAVGLNPMWAGDLPITNATYYPYGAPAGSPDYYLSSYAKFFYNESFKQRDANNHLNELGLLYRVSSAALAYESGLIQTRYGPLDPSCRYPSSSATAIGGCQSDPRLAGFTLTGAPSATPQPNDKSYYYQEYYAAAPAAPATNFQVSAPWMQSFGVASDFVIVYDLLKFLSETSSGATATDATTLAAKICNSPAANIATLLKPLVETRFGAGTFPTTLDQTVSLAQKMFSAAYNNWLAMSPLQGGGSGAYFPHPSSALIAAAAISGNKVDPLFWGLLSEAEQIIYKNYPVATYTTWANAVFTSAMVRNDFGLSLTEFGTFRGGASTPPQHMTSPDDYLKNGLDFTGVGLQNLLREAIDSAVPLLNPANPESFNFALVRGPIGLDALSSDRFEIASTYLITTTPTPTPWAIPYPNAFLEVAESGRPVIDGRLFFTSDGNVDVFDNDYKRVVLTFATNGTPFEIATVNSYQRVARTQVLGGAVVNTYVPPFAPTAALSIATRAQPGLANPAQVSARSYSQTVSVYKPINRNASDSRFFKPALQFWLVMSEKLSNSVFSTAFYNHLLYNPPQIDPKPGKTVITAGPVRANYQLLNITNVNLIDQIGNSLAPIYGYTPPPANVPRPWLANQLPLDSYAPFLPNATWTKMFSVYVQDVSNYAIKTPYFNLTNSYLYMAPGIIPGVPAPAPMVLPATVPATVTGPAAPGAGASQFCAVLSRFPARDPNINCPQ